MAASHRLHVAGPALQCRRRVHRLQAPGGERARVPPQAAVLQDAHSLRREACTGTQWPRSAQCRRRAQVLAEILTQKHAVQPAGDEECIIMKLDDAFSRGQRAAEMGGTPAAQRSGTPSSVSPTLAAFAVTTCDVMQSLPGHSSNGVYLWCQ